ncbi:MAG TPA: 7-carboxy-7-deazaguanine synthase QueE [Tepidisphaeraceae bacterium]|nr:7-carboxy-7-deazaguanine synthase QueE [Tepidisphaeraceae bacterium]
MKIAEIFYSIQGEGKLAGVPSVFVRASGCNLRCTWCDTPYASWEPEGREMPVGEIIDEIAKYSSKHVVLTGGEPMIMADVEDLCQSIKQRDYHLTIETAATVYKPVDVDLASLSPKLSNSTPTERAGGRFAEAHEKNRLNVDVIQRFIESSRDFQLKFVVSNEADLREIDEILSELRGWKPQDVLLMPEGVTQDELTSRADWIIELCKQRGFRFCPRLHIALFGNKRGT